MICIACKNGYHIDYSLIQEAGIQKISCGLCGATNYPKDIRPCPKCGADVAEAAIQAKQGRNVPCAVCAESSTYNVTPSASFSLVPSVRDLLEHPQTSMVDESRKEQVSVGTAVESALRMGTSCIAEAGTGAGKTLAYMVPALSMGKRVIVATATKQLQDQIMEKDGPWVIRSLKSMGVERTMAVHKGKGNFGCIANFKHALKKKTISKGADTVRMQAWFDEAEKGVHNADLNSYTEPPEWVNKIRVEECGKTKCSMHEQCGYFRNLQEVKFADVVVTNHTLVALECMIPMKLGESGDHLKDFIFGPRNAVIFDEAHQLESAFENVWKDEISQFTVKDTLKKIKKMFPTGDPLTPDDPTEHKVIVTKPIHKSKAAEDVDPFENAPDEIEATIKVSCSFDAMWETGAYDKTVEKTLLEGLKRLGETLSYSGGGTAVVNPEDAPLVRRAVSIVCASMSWIRRGIHPYYAMLDAEVNDAKKTGKASGEDYDNMLQELYAVKPLVRRLDAWLLLAKSWLYMRDDHVYYVKKETHDTFGDSYTMVRQPVDLASILKKHWQREESFIFTSATMSNKSRGEDSFALFQSRLGTHIPDEDTVAVKSPFKFTQRCATYITKDRLLRPPRYNASALSKEKYYDNMAKEIGYWTALTRGNALVLFASAHDLEQAYKRLVADPRLSPYPIHAQMNGDVSAPVALARYEEDAARLLKNTPRTGPILLGLQSFWGGVSIKGPKLLNVILTRMPFPVPTDPLFQKRQEMLGDLSFAVQSLYPVSISARQGSGRLLRTVLDMGIVVMLDERVGTSQWGSQIIQSMDVAQARTSNKAQLKKTWDTIDRITQRMLGNTKL